MIILTIKKWKIYNKIGKNIWAEKVDLKYTSNRKLE